MTKSLNLKKGFTLLEILLVVGIIAILAGIVILAINPTKQLGDARNAQRRSDVLTILNAIYQYSIDNSGALPASLDGATEDDDDCYTVADGTATANANSVAVADLTELTTDSTYLSEIPTDPIADGDSDYVAVVRTTGRITVCAPNAENSVTIYVTR